MPSLSPVARNARPTSVDRNQTSATTKTASSTARIPTDTQVPSSPLSRSGVNKVVVRSRGTFALPMIRRLIEYNAIWVKMPASSGWILPQVLSRPVTSPATNPTAVPARVAVNGCHPATIRVAAVAAPLVKLPSMVRSAKSRTRKVR